MNGVGDRQNNFLDYLPREEVSDKYSVLCLHCSDTMHDLPYTVNHLQIWSIIALWQVLTENITSFIKRYALIDNNKTWFNFTRWAKITDLPIATVGLTFIHF